MKMKKELLLSMLMVMMPLMANAGMNDNWDKAKQKLAPLYKYADRYEDKLKGDEGYLIFNNISNPDSLTDLNIEADLNAYITLIGQGQTGELSIPRKLYNPDIEVEIGDDVFYSKYNFTYYRVGNDTKSIAFDNETISDITQKYGYVSCNDFYYLAPPTPTTNPIVEIKLQGNMPSTFDKTKIEQPAQVMSGKYDICVIMVPDWYKTLTELEMTDANEMTDGKFFDSAYIDSISAISKMSFTCQLRYNDNAANGRDITSAKSSTIEYDGKRVDTLLVFEDFEFPYSYKNLKYNYPTLRIEGATNSRMGKQGFLYSLCIDRVIMRSKESGEEIVIAPKTLVTYTEGQMATIVLPTTPDASKGKYYRLDRCEEGKIIFTEEREPKARTPYIIVPNEDFSIDLDKLELEGLYCDSTNIVGVSFIGTYNKKVFGYKDSFYYHILDSTPDCRDDVGKYLYVGPLRAFLEIDWRKNNHQNLEEMEVVLQDIPNDSVLHNHPKYYQDGDYWVQALVPWNFEERIHDYETEGTGRNFSLYFFYVEGDTIIDNKEYKCVHAKTWKYDCEETYDHQPEGLVEGKQIPNVLFMREDADGRQWRRLATLSEEALLFVFSCPFEKGQKIRYCRHENLDDVLETLSYEVKAYSSPSHHRGIKAELSDEAPEGYYYYDLEINNVSSIELPNGEQVPFANGRIAFGWGDVYQGDLFHQLSPLCEGSEGMFLYRVHQGQVILQNKNNVIKINDIIGKDVLSLFNKPMDANTYFPTGMKWKEVPAEPDYPLDTLYAVTWEIGPDTIINNLNYKQIIREGKTINIWIRENAGKIWLMTEEYPRELLLYNFNWVPDEVLYTEYIRETDNGMEVFRDEFTVNDYKTTKCGNHTYQYIFNDEFATIRGIGRVSDLNKNSGLLGYRKMKEILPGLIYSKVLWINRNNEEIFRSEIAEEWTCEIPTDTNQNVPVSFAKNQMATIILPTTPDANKGKYYALNRCEEGKIIFTEEREPKARTPYIILPNEDFTIDLDKLDLESLLNDTVSVKGAMFIGSYSSAERDCQEGFYIDILDATPDCQIINADQRKAAVGALRAYLVAPWDDPYAQGGSRGVTEKREIVLLDNGTSLTSIPSPVREGSIYDLSGRKVSSQLKKGIYIQNGVKRVVR